MRDLEAGKKRVEVAARVVGAEVFDAVHDGRVGLVQVLVAVTQALVARLDEVQALGLGEDRADFVFLFLGSDRALQVVRELGFLLLAAFDRELVFEIGLVASSRSRVRLCGGRGAGLGGLRRRRGRAGRSLGSRSLLRLAGRDIGGLLLKPLGQ